MKKDKNLMKFTSFVLLVVVIALILVAGTFAKYTSSASGESTAIVAKWSFLVNGTDITQLEDNATIAFDLFSTINEENGGTEEDVAKAAEGNPSIIAPGTSGSFKLLVQNASEVTAKYTIGFVVDSYYMSTDEETGEETKVEVNIPLKYYISDEEISDLSTISDEDWSDELTETSETLAINSEEQAKIVYWKWAFEKMTTDSEGNEVVDADNDENDTILGINTPTVTVTATITAEQYDASENPVVETPVEDFEAYALLPFASGYAHLTEWVGDVGVMSATETVYLEAGTIVTGKLGGIHTYLLARASKDDNSVVNMEDIDTDNGIIIISEKDSATIENTGWYDFVFANKNNSDIREDQLQQKLGDYVSFSK